MTQAWISRIGGQQLEARSCKDFVDNGESLDFIVSALKRHQTILELVRVVCLPFLKVILCARKTDGGSLY